MPTPPPPPPLSAADANAALRAFAAGRRRWTREELVELDRLRRQWQAAVRAEIVRAA